MKLIINFEDGYDIEAEIKVDKDGFARIEDLANSLALPKQRAAQDQADGYCECPPNTPTSNVRQNICPVCNKTRR